MPTKISHPQSFHNVAKVEVELPHRVERSNGNGNGKKDQFFYAMVIRLFDEDGKVLKLEAYSLGNQTIPVTVVSCDC